MVCRADHVGSRKIRGASMSLIDPILKFVSRHPLLDKSVNRHFINHFATTTVSRPRAFSLWSPNPSLDPKSPDYITDYTSWPSPTNKRYSGRHLKPADAAYTRELPPDAPYAGPGQPPGQMTALFARSGEMRPSRSS